MAYDKLSEEKLLTGTLRLNGKILGLVLGIPLGLVIFTGTNWLLVKGALAPGNKHTVGPHL